MKSLKNSKVGENGVHQEASLYTMYAIIHGMMEI